MKTPMVSVVMPAYNAERFVGEAIVSVLSQAYGDWELIVVDDSSADATCEVASEAIAGEPRARLVSNRENLGVARTRNRGISLANGRYVALLDADDYWLPGKLATQVELAERTHADMVYCSYSIVGEDGIPVCADFLVPKRTTFDSMLSQSVISCSTALLRASSLPEGPFPTGVQHEDLALWLAMLRDGCTAYGTAEVLACYRQVSGSRASNKLGSALGRWRVLRDYLGLPWSQSVRAIGKYAAFGAHKYRRRPDAR